MLDNIDASEYLAPYTGDWQLMAERVVRNRILIAACNYEIGSEEYNKVWQVADTVRVTVTVGGNKVSLSVDYDTSLAGSDAYLAIEEGERMIEVFLGDSVEDAVSNDTQFIDALSERVENEIYSRMGGG